MRVNVNWKRVLFVVVDLILAAYLVMAVTLWNRCLELKASGCLTRKPLAGEKTERKETSELKKTDETV